jgi:hypothetical protein
MQKRKPRNFIIVMTGVSIFDAASAKRPLQSVGGCASVVVYYSAARLVRRAKFAVAL